MQTSTELNPRIQQTLQAKRKLRVGVLTNPLSGGNRKGIGAVLRVLKGHQDVLHCDTQEPQHMASILEDFSQKEVEILVINGGDGTVQAVLTALFNQKPFETIPFLAVLTSGTSSMIARDVGLMGTRTRGLQRLLSWANSGNGSGTILTRHVLQMQVAPDQEPRFGMFFGTGAIMEGIRFFRKNIENRGPRGELGPGMTIAWFLLALISRRRAHLTPTPMTIGLDHHQSETRKVLSLLVTTLERLFLGIRPYWGNESGSLHYTAIGTDPQHLLRVLPSLLRGRRHRFGTPQNGYVSQNVQEIRLAFQSDFTLDGELFQPFKSSVPVVLRDGGTVSFMKC